MEAPSLADLADRPDLAASVADRLWRGWGLFADEPLAEVARRVRASLVGPGLPFCVVAHEADRLAGTAAVVAGREEGGEGPVAWIAALWVDEDRRRRGLGARLLDAAVVRAAALGVTRLRLVAEPDLAEFYEACGWRMLEGGGRALGAAIFGRDRETAIRG